MPYNDLNAEEIRVIENRGTEMPFSGKFSSFYENGVYTCRKCNAPLFNSNDKFDSGSGWPSFDDAIAGAVKEVPDADGRRVEIVCANCDGHLGHVFKGEQMTPKSTRHCVNSISLGFQSNNENSKYKKAYFAAGCFWGVEYWFQKQEGVISADSGYMGGYTENPTYQDICYRDTGHLETVEVTYDPKIVSFERLTKLFFETHNPEQTNGQGPDIGSQYLSAIFTNDIEEEDIAQKLINQLEDRGMNIATMFKNANAHKFYIAEHEHQNYYKLRNSKPYCHSFIKRF
ncbi:bifunctional methionine sulfoxide reductase B/A protein [Sulfurovum sp. bin170]|uniref:bifunctional methionine sulfoxide reductase B/A protein n=1 Tax=Sulfurovum sp. bin170 TaxID=2695268 RepID=UPI0013DE8C08|nr:bifunctional methionine sulfoxide reductase B/A protein [Sulfurovum sp. bin170]NEW60148.1 bifunctional methionine sulfoxide reductase B/A protein [Sulfurovum sp. bin170]